MATHWAFKNPALVISRCRDANPVPTSPLADDLATAPSGGGVLCFCLHPAICLVTVIDTVLGSLYVK